MSESRANPNFPENHERHLIIRHRHARACRDRHPPAAAGSINHRADQLLEIQLSGLHPQAHLGAGNPVPTAARLDSLFHNLAEATASIKT